MLDLQDFLSMVKDVSLSLVSLYVLLRFISWQRERDQRVADLEQAEQKKDRGYLDLITRQADRFAALTDAADRLTDTLRKHEERSQARFEASLAAVRSDVEHHDQRLDCLEQSIAGVPNATIQAAQPLLETVRDLISQSQQAIEQSIARSGVRVSDQVQRVLDQLTQSLAKLEELSGAIQKLQPAPSHPEPVSQIQAEEKKNHDSVAP